ncbi:MAG: cysteine dioxygenase [Rhodospirillaceae bacterium]|jgi:3-mercaptopropionate dioxygenase|nr:cysteine dioxygenase [Rhodospirillaceae bacterium]MBT5454978.1 cysteine dioxygenase [Rhodospirillaceae bacterium]
MTREQMSSITSLRSFVNDMTRLVERSGDDEVAIRGDGGAMLQKLVASDDWLPEICALPDPASYRQYLIWCDPLERFSVVSFVWGPGQTTPVHDHTVWGLIGMLRGAEDGVAYAPGDAAGQPMQKISEERLIPGQIAAVSPTIGDIHTVSNALEDKVSISVHVYGANIGAVARHVYDRDTGTPKDFVSGYSNEVMPNLFDRSADVRAALG